MERSEEILLHWFGPLSDGWSFGSDRIPYWFEKHDKTDDELRTLFGEDAARAAAGELDPWAATPRGRLALILLFDQLPRNLHRGTPAAWAQDAKALALSREGIALGHDRALRPIERVFFYLPLEHAEDLSAQMESVRFYDELQKLAPDYARPGFRSFYDYALRHLEIIDRFGRFPHRNEILGRASTPEEVEFLKEPNSSF